MAFRTTVVMREQALLVCPRQVRKGQPSPKVCIYQSQNVERFFPPKCQKLFFRGPKMANIFDQLMDYTAQAYDLLLSAYY